MGVANLFPLQDRVVFAGRNVGTAIIPAAGGPKTKVRIVGAEICSTKREAFTTCILS